MQAAQLLLGYRACLNQWASIEPPTAPALVDIDVVSTTGLLHMSNVWDSGRGLGDFESQSASSGMIAEPIDQASIRYRCNDIGTEPDFIRIVFSIAID